MSTSRTSSRLDVAMNGLEVGRLTRVARSGLRFQYATSWLEREAALPISLSLPLSAQPYSGDVVWNFFDNLLPDNDDIRQRIQRHLGAESTRPFDLLQVVGRDCVGALQLGEMAELADVRHVTAVPLSDGQIADKLRNTGSRPLGMSAADREFRLSLAGAQEKTALLWYDGRWHEPRGTTPTTHILKLPIGPLQRGIDFSDSVENEWLCLRLLGAFGLPVVRAEIRDFEDVRVLAVERYDRDWGAGRWIRRLPQEDMCQALGVAPGRKYEEHGGPGIASALQLLQQSETPDEDRDAFFRAQVVFWLLAAIDGHAKNFSLFLRPGGSCKMAPLYDVVSAYPILTRNGYHEREIRMAMAVRGKNRHYRWIEIHGRHWLSTARHARYSEARAREILDECDARVEPAVDEVGAALPPGFPAGVAEPIFDRLRAAAKRLRGAE